MFLDILEANRSDPTRFVDGAELPRVTPNYTFDLANYPGNVHVCTTEGQLKALLGSTSQTSTQGGVHPVTNIPLARGDQIRVDPNVMLTGENMLPALPPDSNGVFLPILLTTTEIATMQAQPGRVGNGVNDPTTKPAWMPRFRQTLGGASAVLRWADGAHRWHIAGIGFDAPSVTGTSGVVYAGNNNATSMTQLPNDVVFYRCWGYVGRNTPTMDRTRFLSLNCRTFVVKDCQFWVTALMGFDDQAIHGITLAGPGLVDNCLLVAGSENTMFGGADT